MSYACKFKIERTLFNAMVSALPDSGEIRHYLHGIHFAHMRDSEGYEIYSTDGRLLLISKVEVLDRIVLQSSGLIFDVGTKPLLKKFSHVVIEYDEALSGDKYQLYRVPSNSRLDVEQETRRLIDGKYPDVRRVVPVIDREEKAYNAKTKKLAGRYVDWFAFQPHLIAAPAKYLGPVVEFSFSDGPLSAISVRFPKHSDVTCVLMPCRNWRLWNL